MRRPWLKWYPSDWRADKAVRLCSAEARGVWLECINLMHEGEPYGYLTTDSGSPYSHLDLAREASLSLAEVKRGMAELERRQVFSRTEDGIVFSRKLVRTADISDKRAASGKTGANRRRDLLLQQNLGNRGNFAEANSSANCGSGSGSVSSSESPRDPTTTTTESEAYSVADSLLAALVAFNPEHDHKRTWEIQWRPKYARDLLELHQGGVTYARMRSAIAWYPSDDFWPGSVADSVTFARNFRAIETKMLAAQKKAATSPAAAADRQAAAEKAASERTLTELREAQARAQAAPVSLGELRNMARALAKGKALPGGES